MKKIFLLLGLFTVLFSTAQSLPITTINNLKITNPVPGTVHDSLLVYRGTSDKVVRFLPVSNIMYSLPSQTGNAGKYLKTNGTSESWENIDFQTQIERYSTTGFFDLNSTDDFFAIRIHETGGRYGFLSATGLAFVSPTFGDSGLTNLGMYIKKTDGTGLYAFNNYFGFTDFDSLQNYLYFETPTGVGIKTIRDTADDKIVAWTDEIVTPQAGTNITIDYTDPVNPIINSSLGYTAENQANKSNSYTVSSTTTYPNTKALVEGLATKAPVVTPKTNILILAGGQSNIGTVDPATGRVPYADMPSYLSATPTNIKYINTSNALATWTPDPALEWGWLNQTLYILSQEYTNVIFSKRSTGGTNLLLKHGGTYPRDNFKVKMLAGIAAANTEWGAGNYDTVILWDLGETNGNNLADAQLFEQASKEWFQEIRSQVIDLPIIFRKMGTFQNQAFAYITSNIQPAQQNLAVYDFKNKMVTGRADARWELKDQTGDVSHLNSRGAISCGTNFADKIFEVLGRTKTNTTAPTLVSITCTNASPSVITLTYSSALNSAIVPFCKDFEIKLGGNLDRKVTSVSVSGSAVTLNISEPIYVGGTTYNLSYYPSLWTESALQDINGNLVKGFTDNLVTSTSSIGIPTYTNRYTSNFATTDSWNGINGGSVAAVVGPIGGQSNVLECTASDQDPQHYRNSVFTGTIGHKYRIKFSIYVPAAYYGNGSFVTTWNFAIGVTEIVGNFYNQVRGIITADTWQDIEYTYTATTGGGALYFVPAGTNIPVGGKFYLRNVVVDKIN